MPTVFSHNPSHPAHRREGHAERPARLEAVLRRLQQDPVWDVLRQVAPTTATDDDVRAVHTPAYLERIEASVAHGGTQLDPDTYTTPDSLAVAREGLGALFAVTDAVAGGAATNGFAALRPPGHHATPDEPMGFCLISNVALAARRVQRAFGVQRVAIVDYDVHHGNGTQDVFYEDPNVLFMSTHQHPLYPGTGRVDERGRGPGAGSTLNVPLPPHTGDAGFEAAFRRVLEPALLRFRPELIFLSAGYDAHWMDPLSTMNLSAGGYATLTRIVLEWADACCGGRLVATLEGGYHTEALAACVRDTVHLLTDPSAQPDDPLGPAPQPETVVDDYLRKVAAFLAP